MMRPCRAKACSKRASPSRWHVRGWNGYSTQRARCARDGRGLGGPRGHQWWSSQRPSGAARSTDPRRCIKPSAKAGAARRCGSSKCSWCAIDAVRRMPAPDACRGHVAHVRLGEVLVYATGRSKCWCTCQAAMSTCSTRRPLTPTWGKCWSRRSMLLTTLLTGDWNACLHEMGLAQQVGCCCCWAAAACCWAAAACCCGGCSSWPPAAGSRGTRELHALAWAGWSDMPPEPAPVLMLQHPAAGCSGGPGAAGGGWITRVAVFPGSGLRVHLGP
jgi:hypothetical protein